MGMGMGMGMGKSTTIGDQGVRELDKFLFKYSDPLTLTVGNYEQ
jgi:hypothetical protein